MTEDYSGIRQIIYELSEKHEEILLWFTYVSRILIAFLAVVIIVRCLSSLLRDKSSPEIWGYIAFGGGKRIPVKHWENTIGRSPSCDIVMDFPTISRNHAALIRNDAGEWEIYDLNSKTGVFLNENLVEKSDYMNFGDHITLGGVDAVLQPLSPEEEKAQITRRPKPGKRIRPGVTLMLLTELQIILFLQLLLASGAGFSSALPIVFLCHSAVMWGCYIFYRMIRRVAFEVETIAFFLSTVGLSVTASSVQDELYKQFAALLIGIAVFLVLCWMLRDLKRAKFFRWPAVIFALGLFAATLVFGEEINGAQNWIFIGGISIQSSELIKLSFIYAGAATLDRLLARRNLVLFILFTGICVAALAYMSDFGAALIFFVTFLVIAFLRSGDLAAIALYCSAAVFAGFIAVSIKPYIADRFSTWGKAWDYAYDQGFQQTRTMSAAASGGFFGVGAGEGWLKNIVASDTDLVFGMVCEELGLIVALCAVAAVGALAVFTVKSAANGRSSFYVIAACAATSMLVFQTILNVLGAVDILPLTGVTFPFVSNGGSSIVSAFGMLAFIKATDTRQNASPAIRLKKQTMVLLSDYKGRVAGDEQD